MAWDDPRVTGLWVLVGLVVLGVIAVVAGGRGGGLGPAGSDRPGPWLPTDRPATGADVDAVSFGVGFRGYRMDEVDEVLDRLAEQLKSEQSKSEQSKSEQSKSEQSKSEQSNAEPFRAPRALADDEGTS